MSIHADRMSYSPDKRRVLNTCAPPKPPCKKLDRKRARLNARRNDHAATLQKLPSSVNPAAFRQPGSMKQGK